MHSPEQPRIRSLFTLLGTALLMLSLLVMFVVPTATARVPLAQDYPPPAPEPRPTLVPVEEPPQEPPEEPPGDDDGDGDDGDDDGDDGDDDDDDNGGGGGGGDDDDERRPVRGSAPVGCITGTVLDVSQQPAPPIPGIAVTINDFINYTDEFGNYNRCLLALGDYVVQVAPAEGAGFPAQEPQNVTLDQADEIQIVHLGVQDYVRTSGPVDIGETPPDAPRTIVTIPVDLETRIRIGEGNRDTIEIVVPEGAVSEPIQLSVILLSEDQAPPPGAGQTFVDVYVLLTAFTLDGEPFNRFDFNLPIEITWLAPIEGDLDQVAPTVVFYDPIAGAWVNIPTQLFTDGSVTGYTDHITLFALN